MNLIDVLIDWLTNPLLIISLIFWVIVGVLFLILRKVKKGEALYVFFPLIAMARTKKLNNIIKKISNKVPKFWKAFWTIGIFVSFAFIIFALYFFFYNLIVLFIDPKIENAITPLIPGVTVDLPFFAYLIIPLLFIITTHELAHGIAATVDGVEVKSTGVIGAGPLFILLYGAFVEVDEREMNSPKVHRNTRLRIAAAGTYVNAITAGIAFLLIINFPALISPFYGNLTVQVDSVLEEKNGGFNYGNLNKNDVIVALKQNTSSDFIYLDMDNGISLNALLYNQTSKINCSVGDTINIKIYKPSLDSYVNTSIHLGPRYKIGILYEYISNEELKITRIYTSEEGGNNYDKNLIEDLIITKINGIPINVANNLTLEKALTTKDLNSIILTSSAGTSYSLDLELLGVLIGINTKYYYLPINPISKLFGGEFPWFVFMELLWLWGIAFSITLFNMLPIPVFDGDRVVKEIIGWKVGEEFKEKRNKTDKFLFDKKEKLYGLSEFRVEKINSIKIKTFETKTSRNFTPNSRKMEIPRPSELLVGEENYTLIDKIGDGYTSTVEFNIPENTSLDKKSVIEINYEYWHDEKKALKNKILNTIRIITLTVLLGNFILSFVKFGDVLFWA